MVCNLFVLALVMFVIGTSETLAPEWGYFVFISDVLQCGAIRISSIDDFNFNFGYDDLGSGIISIIREDLLEKIILEFYEENGTKYIDVELLRSNYPIA